MGLRFELPQGLRKVHQVVISIRWGDMDAQAHVNNTVYFRYMEVARLDWLFASGIDNRGSRHGPVIVNAFCNFLRQLAYPGKVVVSTFIGDIGTTSFDSFHTLERSDEPGTCWAEGGARVVWTDLQARKAMPIPADFRARLEGR